MTMILLATYFFTQDSTVKVEETELRIVDTVGSKVRSDLDSIVEKIDLLLFSFQQNFNNKEQKKFFLELFFNNDPNFLMVGTYSKENDKLKLNIAAYNQKALKEFQISEYDIDKIIHENSRHFLNSFTGKSIIHNVSSGMKHPTFALSIPFQKKQDEIIICIVHTDKIKDSFQKSKSEVTEVFLVNDQGDVIAHPDSKLVMSEANLYEVPVVKEMLTKEFKNKKIRFKDKTSGDYFIGTYKKIGFAGAGVISTVPEKEIFKSVYQIQRNNFIIMLISICFAFIVIYNFSRSITTPLLRLVSATKEIEKGNFRVDISPSSKDEVGLLTNSFVEMGKGLEERDKVKNILGSMIDPTVVKEALIDLSALKRGKETEITAFFSDVAGFSTISEQLTSIDLASLLNEYLSAMTIILKKYEGVLDKYIGDAIVGIFNAPVPVPNHPLEAARASIDMISKLEDLREYWSANNLYTKEAQAMGIRIGLNTGSAKVGFMGTDALASYTMMGDTVNLAARLEAAAKDYGVHILISEATKNKIESEMFTRELDCVRVKGKNEPVKLYELVCKKTDVSKTIKESSEIYEEAFKLYLNMNWEAAIKKFQQAAKAKNKIDKAVDLLTDRCIYYLDNPPSKDWDGVFTRKHK
jgi:adenylate cyclase